MGVDTRIEWAHDTLNLWWGCTKVSEGCQNCYAERLSDKRFGGNAWGPSGVRRPIASWPATLREIARKAAMAGERRRVFVNSMSDTFEGPETCGGADSRNWRVIQSGRKNLYEVMWENPMLDFLVLTKRPRNALFAWADWGDAWPSNCWLGTSVEDQATADARLPWLLKARAAIRFVSCEPLLGPVDLTPYHHGIDWIIVGGESGPNARPMNAEWVRAIRDHRGDAKFFFKQWGGPTAKARGRVLDLMEWSEVPQ